jgi:hypothetical protein
VRRVTTATKERCQVTDPTIGDEDKYATSGQGLLPAQYKTYSEWWIAERVACVSCGQQLTTRWRERRWRLDKRLHHLHMVGVCVRARKYRGALWHVGKVVG